MKKLVITITEEKTEGGGTVTSTDYEGDKTLQKTLLKSVLHDLLLIIETDDKFLLK